VPIVSRHTAAMYTVHRGLLTSQSRLYAIPRQSLPLRTMSRCVALLSWSLYSSHTQVL